MESQFGELVTNDGEEARGSRRYYQSFSRPRPLLPSSMSLHIDEDATSQQSGASESHSDAPTLEEVIKLTHQELTIAQENDLITESGRAALSLLRANPNLCADFAYQKLHDVPYKEVRTCWRRLHTEATLWKVLNTAKSRTNQTQTEKYWIDEVVKLLDTTLILTGAPRREEVIELWFAALDGILAAHNPADRAPEHSEQPAKRLKLDRTSSIPSAFPIVTTTSAPLLRHPLSRVDDLSLFAFQRNLSSPTTHTPLIIENAIHHWPALSERPWSDPNYLLKRTLGGRRLVPIETGRSYTDSGWGQKISTFKDFLTTYMLDDDSLRDSQDRVQTGYLAQHDLFAQIPSLRADISIPDFCYCDPASNPIPSIKETSKLEEPLLNAWFGPKGTISPLHTDPYHNILAQVVGFKYVRLYAPDQTDRLYPRSVDENGVDMSNTSQIDLDEAMEIYPEIGIQGDNISYGGTERDGKIEDADERRTDFEERYSGFTQAKYVEGILGPGECLYLPPGWWHYVRSLSPSFSVSFWFN